MPATCCSCVYLSCKGVFGCITGVCTCLDNFCQCFRAGCCCDNRGGSQDACITIDDNKGFDCVGCVLFGRQCGTGGCCIKDVDGHSVGCIICEVQCDMCRCPCYILRAALLPVAIVLTAVGGTCLCAYKTVGATSGAIGNKIDERSAKRDAKKEAARAAQKKIQTSFASKQIFGVRGHEVQVEKLPHPELDAIVSQPEAPEDVRSTSLDRAPDTGKVEAARGGGKNFSKNHPELLGKGSRIE